MACWGNRKGASTHLPEFEELRVPGSDERNRVACRGDLLADGRARLSAHGDRRRLCGSLLHGHGGSNGLGGHHRGDRHGGRGLWLGTCNLSAVGKGVDVLADGGNPLVHVPGRVGVHHEDAVRVLDAAPLDGEHVLLLLVVDLLADGPRSELDVALCNLVLMKKRNGN